ncbi:MAG: 1-(5-phosphoribosyl)-5-((5-phosphoribosylamino)methylideneamino)imidazole-4-carboxamide isomerase [Chloroflexi bacterium]|nr:1-(5-phosphoribosyl)-5-((5-phosphoribosylamino)methylideneamino)imidazole-4-carboxamide isomerase [Chloroflexota bacterium]
MELICAIDLLDGGAVRLVQGDYGRRIAAEAHPVELARRFVAAGCRRLHVVDLAGARAGRPTQLDMLREVVAAAHAEAPGVVVEAGGGLRRAADVAALLSHADEALLGTAAIEGSAFLRTCVAAHPGRIIVSLDLRDEQPVLDGWLRTGETDAAVLARRLFDDGARRLIVTDTARDGTLDGPNLGLLARLRAAVPDAVLVAAGGIGSIDDLQAVADVGCDGAVVGLALLTGAIDPAEALAVLA